MWVFSKCIHFRWNITSRTKVYIFVSSIDITAVDTFTLTLHQYCLLYCSFTFAPAKQFPEKQLQRHTAAWWSQSIIFNHTVPLPKRTCSCSCCILLSICVCVYVHVFVCIDWNTLLVRLTWVWRSLTLSEQQCIITHCFRLHLLNIMIFIKKKNLKQEAVKLIFFIYTTSVGSNVKDMGFVDG